MEWFFGNGSRPLDDSSVNTILELVDISLTNQSGTFEVPLELTKPIRDSLIDGPFTFYTVAAPFKPVEVAAIPGILEMSWKAHLLERDTRRRTYSHIYTDTIFRIDENDGVSFWVSTDEPPNPFSPNTRIKYWVYQPSQTLVTIRDITGKIVDTLVNEFKEEGFYTSIWDVSTFASGIYFYDVSTVDGTISRKMLFLK